MSVGAVVHDLHDTIVAVASGAQPALRGIVRLSGPAIHEVLGRCFQPAEPWGPTKTQPRRHPGRVQLQGPSGEREFVPVDLWYWPTTRSYTGQPAAELHLLGLPFLLERVVRECLRCGARLAAPGEFTQRAFLAGRMDLLQAQAVWQVIAADDPAELQQALGQLAGGLSTPLQQLRDELIGLLAHLEAGLDFVDEDIEFISRSKLLGDLERLQVHVAAILQQLRERSASAKLSRVVLVGPPNAGKSSLFNALVGHEAALVSAQRGTTRDYLSSRLTWPQADVELIDTAGLDPVNSTSVDPIEPEPLDGLEQLGQQKATELLPSADALVLCWDGQETLALLSGWARALPRVPDLIVWTKSDRLASSPSQPGSGNLGTVAGDTDDGPDVVVQPAFLTELSAVGWSAVPCVWVSAQTGAGLHDLREVLQRQIAAQDRPTAVSPAGLSTRAVADLEQVDEALTAAVAVARATGGEELVAAELHRAIDHLGHLVGTIYTDDILDSIFSRFCIGK